MLSIKRPASEHMEALEKKVGSEDFTDQQYRIASDSLQRERQEAWKTHCMRWMNEQLEIGKNA